MSVKGLAVFNHATGISNAPRLSEVLFDNKENSFASLRALPCNVEAVEAGLLFSVGRNRLVAVVGPSGWGKTHLMRAVAHRLSAQNSSAVEAVSAMEYLASPQRYDAPMAAVLDDVQDVLATTKQRLALRFALECRVRAGRPTILAFTSPKPNRQIRSFLPSTRDWQVVTMGQPSPAERVLLINQMATAEGLAMSPRLVKVLADQLHGDGRTLAGALKRLRLSGSTWLDTSSIVRALGLLQPFFADNSGWDLKMWILKQAEKHRALFPRVNHVDLAVYTMLKVADLAECEVTLSTGLENSEVYQRSMRFQKQMEGCEASRTAVHQFVELVIGSLIKE